MTSVDRRLLEGQRTTADNSLDGVKPRDPPNSLDGLYGLGRPFPSYDPRTTKAHMP